MVVHSARFFLASALCVAAPVAAQVTGDRAASLDVSATVESVCDIGGSPSGEIPAGVGDFGRRSLDSLDLSFDTLAVALTMTTALSIHCSEPAAYRVSLDYGDNPQGAQRRLRGPSNILIPYELRRGSASAQIWDNRPYAIDIVPGQLTNLPIWGRISALPPGLVDGVYTDRVRVTLEY